MMADHQVPRDGADHTGRFAGRVVLVTGAAGGIGRAIAVRLAGEGAHVVAVDRDASGLEALRGRLEGMAGQLVIEPADLAVDADRGGLVARAVSACGRIDVLVNNAATLGVRSSVLELREADLAEVLTTNLTAAALLCRDAARDMAPRRHGVIINLGSLHEVLPVPGYLAYGTSKGGIAALTRTLAADLAPHGIRVNAVIPGMIESPSMARSLADTGADRDRRPPTLLRRFGTPEEVAGAVAYLACDEAAFITGAQLRVDGGRGLSRFPDPLVSHEDSED